MAAFAWLGLALFAQAALASHGRIEVTKVNAGGNAADTFSFHSTLTKGPGGAVVAPTEGDFTLTGGSSSDQGNVACTTSRPGHDDGCEREWSNIMNVVLKISEAPKAGYTLTSVVCRYTQGQDNNNAYAGRPTESSPVKPASEYAVDLSTGTVTISVIHYDEWVRCWYTNTPSATPPAGTPPAATTPVSTQPSSTPQIAVSPERATPGSARLQGPTGCPTTNAVAASVSGKRIVKVTFYVDNRKVKTITKPNKAGRWTLSVNMRRIGYGGHRVRAKVEFAKTSGTETKNLQLSFKRCGGSAAKPKFTG